MSELLDLNEVMNEAALGREEPIWDTPEEGLGDPEFPEKETGSGQREVIEAVNNAKYELMGQMEDAIKEFSLSSRLYDDLRKFQDDALWQAISPLIMSIINLANNVDKQVEYISGKDEDTEDEVNRMLYFKVQLTDILYEYNIEEIETDDIIFNPKKQKIIGTIPTNDKDLNGRVAQIKHSGFTKGDKVIVKEQVTVYKYE